MAEPKAYDPEKQTAIVHVMDLKETETKENYVRHLATGLCTVWKNNPAAFKWWSGLI
ncbi:hypothetical protein N9218_00815 [bacterium]|jgi:hypothetical protein|nr:hypothetical protein [bacterium]